MAWHDSVSVKIGEYLRLILNVTLFLNLLAFALLSLYAIAKGCYFAAGWLDRVVFANPW